LSDLFTAAAICPASIVAWIGKKARELRPIYQTVGQRVAEVAVRHLDETGYRIAGKLHWLHTTSSLAFTFLSRGQEAGRYPQGFAWDVVVHDHFMPSLKISRACEKGMEPRTWPSSATSPSF
jgi:transposase